MRSVLTTFLVLAACYPPNEPKVTTSKPDSSSARATAEEPPAPRATTDAPDLVIPGQPPKGAPDPSAGTGGGGQGWYCLGAKGDPMNDDLPTHCHERSTPGCDGMHARIVEVAPTGAVDVADIANDLAHVDRDAKGCLLDAGLAESRGEVRLRLLLRASSLHADASIDRTLGCAHAVVVTRDTFRSPRLEACLRAVRVITAVHIPKKGIAQLTLSFAPEGAK